MGDAWLRVPVGADASRWVTRGGVRRVLFVAHNVTSATRLLDVLPLFEDDLDVQCLATCTGSSPFLDGVPELLAGAGLPVLPWRQATDLAAEIDLVVSASYGGELHYFEGRLVVLSHGVGYNKRLAIPDTGYRIPDTGYRIPDTGWPGDGDSDRSGGGVDVAPVFGLGAQWLLHDGKPLATATVLSHPEQLQRLSLSCPEAAPTAVLAGDPCFDRTLDALPHREAFRRRLGVADGQRLVVLNSTWGPRSLFGSEALPWVLDELSSRLPVDTYRVCAVLHPNIWHAHGPGQVRRWLRTAQESGVLLVPPLGAWRQALVAADCVIGDHGSVTFYAAALGRPVLLGAFPEQDLDPGSPVAELGRTAPRMRPYAEPLRAQLDRVIDDYVPGRYDHLAAQTTSAPGKSAALLRQLFYRLMDRAEPHRPALLERLGAPGERLAPATRPLRVLTRVHDAPVGGDGLPEVRVARYACPDAEPPDTVRADSAHSAVPEETRDTTRLSLADLVLGYGPEHPEAWAGETLRRFPYAAMAVAVTGTGACLVRTHDGTVCTLRASSGEDGRPDLCDPAASASALYAWLDSGRSLAAVALAGLTVVTGQRRHHVGVTVSSPLAP
ncbi:hypothetical protein [Streptomyces hypolithicus]